MTSFVYNSIKSENTYGKVYKVLKKSNIQDFIQMTSSEEVLRRKLKGKIESISEDIKTKEEFYRTLSYLFQSMTNIGYTTYEIVEFICHSLNAGTEKNPVFNEEEKKEIIEFIRNSFCFVHADYKKLKIYQDKKNKHIIDRILFGHDDKQDWFNMGIVYGTAASRMIGPNPEFKKDITSLSTFSDCFIAGQSPDQTLKKMKQKFSNKMLNKNIVSPSKQHTSVSSILISNPNIRVGTQNNLELSTFFNGITTLEMNKSYPYLNATFVLPSLNSQTLKQQKQKGNDRLYSFSATTSTMNSFLFGNLDKNKKTQIYDDLAGNKRPDGLVETNMSLFTSPQTLVNLNEEVGHSQNHPSSKRRTTPHDPTQPLATIKSFSINASATKGLMSYKSGRLNLVLHDRTRMNDIAPFVKPDLLGAFGAEIVLEYGWSNPDEDNPKNPLGYFIGNSKVTEKYMIVNSSLTIDNTGLVNIDLSIAMKGPYEFKNQQISTRVKNRVEQNQFESAIADLNYYRSLIFFDDINYFESFQLNNNSFNSMFRETTRINPEQNDKLRKFTAIHQQLYFTINNNFSNFLTISSVAEGISLSFDTKKLKLKLLQAFCNLLVNEKESVIEKKTKNSKSNGTDAVFIIKNKHATPESTTEAIKNIFKTINRINILINNLSRDDIKEGENESKIIESIMGSANYIDHFYPTSKKLYPDHPQNYLSLGAVINTIVQLYVANPSGKLTSRFDEIQTIFYTANENSAAMSNESIASFLIDRKMLSDFLKDIFSKKTVITPESLISQIINKFVQVGDNITLGLSDLYVSRNRDYKKAVEYKNKFINSSNTLSAEKTAKLRSIYGLSSDVKDKDVKFVMPMIHMNFDCLTTGGITNRNIQRSILRISIYDRSNSPFSASSEILQKIYQGKLNENFGTFIKQRKDHKNNKRSDREIIRKSLEYFNQGQINELDSIAVIEKEETEEKNRLLQKKIIVRENGKYTLNTDMIADRKNYIGNIKDIFKEMHPSLTFGTQNSVMISANVSTINENKLSTIFMTRSDRNDQSLINSRINKNLPLVVMPSQASIEIFGCPWVNFGQSIFLDFETGTTIDNRYVITGITHNLTPGKFTTQLTLSYGDNFGSLLNLEEQLNESISERKKAQRKRNQGPNETQNDMYTIDPSYATTQPKSFSPNLPNLTRD